MKIFAHSESRISVLSNYHITNHLLILFVMSKDFYIFVSVLKYTKIIEIA